MADLSLNTADRVSVVESFVQLTAPAAEAIEAGAAVRLDTSTGKFTNANGSSAAEARIYGIALKSVAAGEAVTAVRKGVLEGFDLSGENYDAPVYLSDTDGTLGDIAGTVSVVVGRVVPVHGNLIGGSPEKVLFVDL